MYRASLMTALFAASTLVGCAGGPQPGEVELQLTGADQIQLFSLPAQPNSEPGDYGVVSAIVTIKEIDAKVNGTWTPVVTMSQTVDLLQLDNKTVSMLGVAKLPTGHVDELRFVLDQIGDYVVLKSGDKKPLEVPDNGILKVDGKLDSRLVRDGHRHPRLRSAHQGRGRREPPGVRAHVHGQDQDRGGQERVQQWRRRHRRHGARPDARHGRRAQRLHRRRLHDESDLRRAGRRARVHGHLQQHRVHLAGGLRRR